MDKSLYDKDIAIQLDDIAFLIRKADWETRLSLTDKKDLLDISKKLNLILTDAY